MVSFLGSTYNKAKLWLTGENRKGDRKDWHKFKNDDELTESVFSNEMRLVLLGKTGNGKSATGNTILGKVHFTASTSFKSCTITCNYGSVDRFGRVIRVIDTPGVLDTNVDEETIRKELIKCVTIAAPGPHAFIVVVRADVRFTAEERNALFMLQNYFGEDIFKYMIILFTMKDVMEKNGKSIDVAIREEMPEEFLEVYRRCGGRHVAFDNEAKKEKKQADVETLFEMVNALIAQNGGTYYNDELLRAAETNMRTFIPQVKKEVEDQFKRLEDELRQKYEKKIQKIEDKKNKAEMEVKHQKELAKQLEEFREREEKYRQKLAERSEEIEREKSAEFAKKIEELREEQRQHAVDDSYWVTFRDGVASALSACTKGTLEVGATAVKAVGSTAKGWLDWLSG